MFVCYGSDPRGRASSSIEDARVFVRVVCPVACVVGGGPPQGPCSCAIEDGEMPSKPSDVYYRRLPAATLARRFMCTARGRGSYKVWATWRRSRLLGWASRARRKPRVGGASRALPERCNGSRSLSLAARRLNLNCRASLTFLTLCAVADSFLFEPTGVRNERVFNLPSHFLYELAKTHLTNYTRTYGYRGTLSMAAASKLTSGSRATNAPRARKYSTTARAQDALTGRGTRPTLSARARYTLRAAADIWPSPRRKLVGGCCSKHVLSTDGAARQARLSKKARAKASRMLCRACWGGGAHAL